MPNQCTSSIRHTPREGNQVPDCLAKMGIEQGDSWHDVDDSSKRVSGQVNADVAGVDLLSPHLVCFLCFCFVLISGVPKNTTFPES